MCDILPRPPGYPDISGDVGVLCGVDAFDRDGPEECERRRTPLCDLTEEKEPYGDGEFS